MARSLLGHEESILVTDLEEKLRVFPAGVNGIGGLSNEPLIRRLKNHILATSSDVFTFVKDLQNLDAKGTGYIEQSGLLGLFDRIGFKSTVSERINLINALGPKHGQVLIQPLVNML